MFIVVLGISTPCEAWDEVSQPGAEVVLVVVKSLFICLMSHSYYRHQFFHVLFYDFDFSHHFSCVPVWVVALISAYN